MESSQDVTHWVTESLGASADEFDIDNIVSHIIRAHGTVGSDGIEPDAFWAIVEHHTLAAVPAPIDVFHAELKTAMATAPIGKPAVWERDGARVEVTGASRVNDSWPQPLATITITVPGLEAETLPGSYFTSWGSLWSKLAGMHLEAEYTLGDAISVIARHHAQSQAHQIKADQEKELRNQAIRGAIKSGVTKYRIAKALGVAESTIGRIQ